MRYSIFVLASTFLLAQEGPVIRVPVRIVSVPTLVFSKENRLIPGLKRSDFRVLDNGVPQVVSLNADESPVSVVIAIQADLEMRGAIAYISKVGSVMDAHLVGATGRAAVIAYNGDIAVQKPFGSGDIRSAFRGVVAKGVKARMVDAGLQGIEMLKDRPRTQAKVLLFIGQAVDRGSDSRITDLEEMAQKENVAIYGLSTSGGSSPANSSGNLDMSWLMSLLGHNKDVGSDELSSMIAETGGTELYFHRQQDLENAIGIMGVELRSAYQLSYYPTSQEVGRHTISVEVGIPGARTFARPGYFLSPN
jgi:VWFA-related protein